MKIFRFPFLFLILILGLQSSFAQEEKEKKEPYIRVIDCKNCQDVAIFLPNPEYINPGYRAHKYAGKVFVQIVINEEGNVASATAISGHPFFRPIVEQAALKAKFKPTIVSGSPVKVPAIIVYQVNPAKLENSVAEKNTSVVSGRENTQLQQRQSSVCSDCLILAKPILVPKPIYPKEAKAKRASGKVVIQLVIDEKGDVVEAKAISGNPLLYAASVKAALKAKFSPAKLIGSNKPAKSSGAITYNFVEDTAIESKPKKINLPNQKKLTTIGIINGKATSLPKPDYPQKAKISALPGRSKLKFWSMKAAMS